MSERKWLGKVDFDGTVSFDDAYGSWIMLYYDKDGKTIGITPIDAGVSHTNLTRPQVKALINHLQLWLDEGKLR
jgi:hypothetical protein